MAIIAWKKAYETGIVVLDNQHKELIKQIDRLFESIRNKKSDDVIEETLDMLYSYTMEHFEHEEKLMEKYSYPGLEEHVVIHQKLRDDVQALREKAANDTGKLATELLNFLRSWLLDHIVDVDKKYGPFLESHAGRFVE